ncbi:uncharacterized protein LACBIDRAFT_322388 [Laccaria bicolor S238N-H82]|uniref:Predicted protein n=1 Tax=Laccaria bicolor (strain S238N-H82 / ATCC MYA-4686) TaxID=486041 RepID=B0CW45_LACBS|nr:uncharacterized protein LACBIDRAFT_322388 [Laccaria bicolor S238N-H82]EDR13002.1 predicted protein [Laccaria bicolor S238N-H82]|eukprot:XP_001875500.1 predicted protein [Laccaria bicolor S238N-H82]
MGQRHYEDMALCCVRDVAFIPCKPMATYNEVPLQLEVTARTDVIPKTQSSLPWVMGIELSDWAGSGAIACVDVFPSIVSTAVVKFALGNGRWRLSDWAGRDMSQNWLNAKNTRGHCLR